MDMANRIAVLEKEVYAIKSELDVIKRDHASAKEFNDRLQRVEMAIIQLQKDVSQLTADVVKLKEEVILIRIDLARLQGECATKADVGNLKGWMIGIALTILTVNLGMNAIIFNAVQKTTAVPKPVQALDATRTQNGRSFLNNSRSGGTPD